MEAIKLENVSFAYDDKFILKNIYLNVNKGDFVGIVGSNGSGKSTLLKLIASEIKPTSGKITRQKLRYSYIAQVVMNKDLSFPATVDEIVSLGLNKKWFLFNSKTDNQKIDEILNELNIFKYKNSQISSLSGGEQQKVKIAKALVSNPDVLILDEPTCGIDKESEKQLINIINNLHEKEHKTIIFVSHKIEHLGRANKVYLIKDNSLQNYSEKEHSVLCCHGGDENV